MLDLHTFVVDTQIKYPVVAKIVKEWDRIVQIRMYAKTYCPDEQVRLEDARRRLDLYKHVCPLAWDLACQVRIAMHGRQPEGAIELGEPEADVEPATLHILDLYSEYSRILNSKREQPRSKQIERQLVHYQHRCPVSWSQAMSAGAFSFDTEIFFGKKSKIIS